MNGPVSQRSRPPLVPRLCEGAKGRLDTPRGAPLITRCELTVEIQNASFDHERWLPVWPYGKRVSVPFLRRG